MKNACCAAGCVKRANAFTDREEKMATYRSYLEKAAKDAERASAAEKKAESVMTEEEMKQALSEIDDRFVTSADDLPPPVKYDRIEYDAPTDEEIAEQAKESLEGYRASSVAEIYDDAEERRKNAESEKFAASEAARRAEKDAEEAYGTASRSLENDLIKRGLARSSVAAQESAAIEQERADAVTAARAAAGDELARIDSEINGLEADMNKALAAFDIAYAAELTERIAELTAEREEKRNEAIKYNNTLTEKERDDEFRLIEMTEDLVGKDGEVPADRLADYYEAKYSVLREYLSGLSDEQARITVRNDPFVREALSDYFYYMLYDEFGR